MCGTEWKDGSTWLAQDFFSFPILILEIHGAAVPKIGYYYPTTVVYSHSCTVLQHHKTASRSQLGGGHRLLQTANYSPTASESTQTKQMCVQTQSTQLRIAVTLLPVRHQSSKITQVKHSLQEQHQKFVYHSHFTAVDSSKCPTLTF